MHARHVAMPNVGLVLQALLYVLLAILTTEQLPPLAVKDAMMFNVQPVLAIS